MGISLPVVGVPKRVGGGGALEEMIAAMNQYGGVIWAIDDLTGTTITSVNSALTTGRDIVLNGNFADWTGDDPDNWTVTEVGDATSNITESGGGGECQIISNTALAQIAQDILITGETYTVTFDITAAATPGSGIRVSLGGDGASQIESAVDSYSFTDTAVGTSFLIKRAAAVATDITIDNVTVTRVNIPANTSLLNGTYSGVTIPQAGPGGAGAGLWDGSNDYGDVFSKTLNDFFNETKGTLMIWAKVAGGSVWTDGVFRRLIYFAADNNNRLFMHKKDSNNELYMQMSAGGTNKNASVTSVSTTDWFNLAFTYNNDDDRWLAYYNAAQQGAELSSLGTWSGNFSSTATVIGSNGTTPSLVWDGYLALAAYFRDELPQSAIQRIVKAGGG